MALARDYVARVGEGFERADRYIETILPGDMRAEESFVDIPDGEILLLRISLSEKELAGEIMGIKQGRDVMLSLRDFVAIARFAIDVRPEEGKADGWFINQEQPFALDINAGTVTSAGRSYEVTAADAMVQDDEIYVRGQAAAQWFDFNLKLNIGTQTATIASAQKWPVQMQMERWQRRQPTRTSPPSLPRGDADYTLASIPNIDIQARQGYVKSGGKGNSFTNYTVTGGNDFLGHTLTTALMGNDEDKLSSARVTLSKDSLEPDLLGPLQARHYEFADVSPTRAGLAGSPLQGLGVRVTDGLTNVTSEATTEIIGDATPGWDVELERNGQVMALVSAGSDGRYVFDEVPLNTGENIFKVIQYGPLGEVKEESRRIVSSANLLTGDESAYDMSLTFAGTQVWQKEKDDSIDKNNPQFSGRYEAQISPTMTAGIGASSVTRDDDRKNYVSASAARSFGSVLANLEAGYDMDGAVAASLGGRFRIWDQAIGGSVTYMGEDYGAVNGNTIQSNYTIVSNAGGLIYQTDGFRVNYDGRSEYRFFDDGSKTFDSTLGVNASIQGLAHVGQSFHSIRQEDALGNDEKSLEGSTTVRGAVLGNRVRAGVNYRIKPDYETDNYFMNVTRRLTRDVQANAQVEYEPEDKYKKGQVSVSWNAGPVVLSPSMTYDSNNTLGAYLNVGTALSRDPASGKVAFSARPLSNSGGFSAFVFLDKDGDMQFTEGKDEPLPNVSVSAIHAQRYAMTDEEGHAFIYDLPNGRLTDVFVDENSFDDPFWLPAFNGVSVLPRPGYTAQATFPVHVAGEIDGTVRVRRPDGSAAPLRSVTLSLYNGEGRKVREAVTAPDGFYVFDRVPPGKYMMLISDTDAKRYKLSRAQPQEIVIGYEGTTLYGNDITVDSGSDDVPVGFAAGVDAYLAANPHISRQDLAGGTVILNLGSYRSQLLMGVTWYKIRARYAGIVGRGRLLVPPSQSYAVPKTGFHELLVELPGVGMDDAFHRCRQLAARGMVCGIEIVPAAGIKSAQAQGVGTAANQDVNH
jgi:hypothetical protein